MKRALRRWQAEYHMKRRLKEDRNQHSASRYSTGASFAPSYIAKGVPIDTKDYCPCFWDKKAMARLKEQPAPEGVPNSDRYHPMISGKSRLTLQERRSLISFIEQQRDLDPEFREIVDKYFWDLLKEG